MKKLLPILLLGLAAPVAAEQETAAKKCGTQSDIKVIAVELDGVIRQWDTTAVWKSVVSGIKAQGWIQNMSGEQLRKLSTTIWNHLKKGNGFGPDELYVAIANEFDNPALANLVVEIVNNQTLNQDVVQRLKTLKQMGYTLVICSKLGKSSYEQIRDNDEGYPDYNFLNAMFGGKATLTLCKDDVATTDGVLGAGSFEAFLARNKLQPHQVLAVVDSSEAVQAAEAAGVKAVRYEDDRSFDVALAKALGRERQLGVTVA